MEVIDDEKLQENALNVGKYLLNQSKLLKSEFDIIGDVRGKGLFIGIELIENHENRKPATDAATYIVNRMKNIHKILVSSDGPDENVIKLKPPMVFNNDNVDEFLRGMKECLTSYLCLDKKMFSTQIGNGCVITKEKIHENMEQLIKSI